MVTLWGSETVEVVEEQTAPHRYSDVFPWALAAFHLALASATSLARPAAESFLLGF
jgi:hypothetical protein